MSALAHAGRAHATLGASSSDRWWNCPGSIRLSEGLPNTTSGFAAEGTAFHEVMEKVIVEGAAGVTPDDLLDSILHIEGHDVLVDEDMVRHANTALADLADLIEPGDTWLIEEKFDLEKLNPPAPMFGTSDVVIYKPARRHLIIRDWKYGAGIAVEAKGNPQLRYYGLGSLLKHPDWTVDTVEIQVYQPRAHHPDGPLRTETIDALDLVEWAMDLLVAAKRTLDPAAAISPGSWCQFCPALAVCPAHAQRAMQAAQLAFQDLDQTVHVPPRPETLTDDQLKALLDSDKGIRKWLDAVAAYATARAKAGAPVPGYKLVEKTGNRAWKDEAATRLFLSGVLDLSDDDIFTDPKLRSPAQIEKVLGASRKGEIADLYHNPVTGTALVQETSSKPAIEAPTGFDALE